MTPEELAEKHQYLYHTTDPENWRGILNHGLLSTNCLLNLFGKSDADREKFIQRRREKSEYLWRADLGTAVITDNIPMHDGKLANCLDDGLVPSQWYKKLNQRVFFWTNEKNLHTLLGAKAFRGRERLVLVFRTMELAKAYHQQMELSPINSGATLFEPARRGCKTFSPLGVYDFKTWSMLHGKKSPASIKEVTITDEIRDIHDLIDRAYTIKDGKTWKTAPGASLTLPQIRFGKLLAPAMRRDDV